MSEERLKDRVAIVTGGGSGIGRAAAQRLARDGARVLVTDLLPERAEETVHAIVDAGGLAEWIRADAAMDVDVRATVERARSLWERLDILVNNAWRSPEGSRGSALEVTEAGWDHAMAIMTKAVFLGARHAVPLMKTGGGGSIVNLSSVHGMAHSPGRLVYETGKAAIRAMTRQLAVEFGPDGVRVNAVCPGHILTERQTEYWRDHPSALRFFEQHYPLRRVGRTEEVAAAIAFLASDEASFVTGQSLVVDGGMTLQLQEVLGTRQALYARENPDTEILWR